MFIIISKRRLYQVILILIILFTFLISVRFLFLRHIPIFVNKEITHEIEKIFGLRSQAILKQDENLLSMLYDTSTKYGRWAYEHELKRMKYLHKWADKQGVEFVSINPQIIIRRMREKGQEVYVNLMVSTEYKYVYENENSINLFRIGTYHSVKIVKGEEDEWFIAREWYTDPFADSLKLDDIKTLEIKNYILSHRPRDLSKINKRRKTAVQYADRYCGAAGFEKTGYRYNSKYINYNSRGGDCANFASQILFEGGKFKKTHTWNYNKGGSKAWVNAHAFKNYMLYSGRGSLIAYGNYEKVYKAAYRLLPGDFIAYGKKGKVTHISVVTGADSKGYTLVNCHNIDRYRVPWDLGWSDKGIRFWLVRVHY
ncbi:amidase domain-containing protein [Caloranaerobacter azorensis]|uniref:Amidase domain-containing protein n=1 Tax=Caloranaerobacter azorensis TaxID=116090 RepID=A0A6P1YE86_9FIRM|nr:amidase domain-containing protein [Caloranaerobacter azorensis]QIB27108.1 amidase domain-containing protein [Caloranaerobacter azorensis]